MNFFWNGQIHLLDLPKYLTLSPHRIVLNDVDEIVFYDYEELDIWHFEKGLRTKNFIDGFFIYIDGYQNNILDDNEPILVIQHNKSGCIDSSYVNIMKNRNLINIQEIIKNSGITFPHCLSINKNGVIVGIGTIWGESHVFILRSINNP